MSVIDDPTPHPYLRVADFTGFGIDRSNIKYIDEEAFEKTKRYTIDKADVYISIAGTIGRVGIVPDDLSGANLTENAAKITNISRAVNHKYLMYYLRSFIGQGQIANRTGGTSQPWETLTALKVLRSELDSSLLAEFVSGVRASDRVKESVKEKSDKELLDHYYLAIGPYMTNLGILCVGRRAARARLGTAPIIQFIKYDETGRKVNKKLWDDHTLSPMQLIDAVWRDVPEFRESYELPDGLFRQHVPVYDGRIIRELLVNALVHRPYTQRGDIYLNLHPDRLEVVNPGLLPLGVTPQNILHQSVRRNNELARVFHDLGLMEREGSGYDLVYEVLLSQGRPLPKLFEGSDHVKVLIEKRIVKPEVIDFLFKADQTYHLRQRERIVLGLLAQSEGLTAREIAGSLELSDGNVTASWMGRLPDIGIIRQTGRTKGTRYFVAPEFLRRLEFPTHTSLARIEPHRLDALVFEDIARYPGSASGKIHERIGPEIKRRQVKLALDRLCNKGKVRPEGDKRGRR